MSNILKNPMDLLIYIALFALGFTVGGSYAVKTSLEFTQFAPLVLGAFGTFSVTFLGIYASNTYAKKLEEEKNIRASHNFYKSSLILISSELDFNEKILTHLVNGLESMPKYLGQYYSQFSFLTEVAKPIKSKAFYAAFYNQSIHEIINNLELFNLLQQAYFNTDLAINGLYLTQDAHKEYFTNASLQITNDMRDNSKHLIDADKNKIQRAIDLVIRAKKMADAELGKYKLNFSTDEAIKT